jgi:hypothetical protein
MTPVAMSITVLPRTLLVVLTAFVTLAKAAAVATGKMKPLSDATGPEKVVRAMIFSSCG